ncbi:MAG: ABC transporter ATP-binding protein [Gammaproteobacteria bacterium]
MMATKDHIVFTGVQKSYDGDSLVVKDLNLNIRGGEFLTMLGPSGSGKTTCLMMLAGFETLTHGEIYINGEGISRIPPHERNIGMVFQNYALFPHFTVAENLAFPLQVRKLPPTDIAKKVARALDMVQLGDFGKRRPGQLSGGQQQRVAVARALVFEPSLVLMDEPLGALDKNLREQMQFELKHLHERIGVTFVYVTHDQSEALTMSDRIAVFDNGIIQQLDSAEDLYEKPQNAFVAGFIGENNALTGKITARGKDGFCTVAAGKDAAQKVNALNIADAKAGETTTLSLRPERVFLGDGKNINAGNAGGGINRFDGCVQECIYMGDHIRIRLSLLDNDEFIVKVANDRKHRELTTGNTIPLYWLAEDCRALN